MPELPQYCWVVHPVNYKLVLVVRGETGYRLHEKMAETEISKEEAESLALALNARLGVTPEVAEAMMFGSMFGWDCPAARMEKDEDEELH